MRLSEHPRFIPCAAAVIGVTGVGMVAAPAKWKIGFVALSVLTVVIFIGLSAVVAFDIREHQRALQAQQEETKRRIRQLINNTNGYTDPDAAA